MSTTEAEHQRPDITELRQAIRDEYDATVVAAGFINFEITWSADVFAGAPQASSAAAYGTFGINFLGEETTE